MSGHGETVLKFSGEIDILDQDTFDLNTPSHRNIRNDFLDTLCDFLTTFNDILQDTGTENMTQSGLSSFHKGGSDIAYTKGWFIGVDNVVVDDWGDVYVDIVLGHTDLGGDLDDLNLDVDLLQFLA